MLNIYTGLIRSCFDVAEELKQVHNILLGTCVCTCVALHEGWVDYVVNSSYDYSWIRLKQYSFVSHTWEMCL